MKTRYTPLLKLKKNELDKCERELQKANHTLLSAKNSLHDAYLLLATLELPCSGTIQEMLSARSFISTQREIVKDKKNWVEFAQEQVTLAIGKLKLSNIEYEKFKYLDFEEIKKIIQLRTLQEAKDLDEIALMTHNKKGNE
ncbi:MAG: flagellar export protein FliJ [Thiovulaceae bacterium]|nr:flagellar export protein FliJ [Sulfurimonadaceae bacterium]